MKRRKALSFLSVIIIASVVIVTFLATHNIDAKDSKFLKVSSKISKALIMRVFDKVTEISVPRYIPTPLDSNDFEYADLSHSYFQKIRNDDRLKHFYLKNSVGKSRNPTDFFEAIKMMEWLRDLFPHGVSGTSYRGKNVLEMIDAAQNGEKFLCGDMAKMLVQLIQAGGTQARTVGLQAAHSGHVVVEMYCSRFNKWAILDPDYNVHYRNDAQIPLSAMELYDMSKKHYDLLAINRITGKSINTLHNSKSKLIEQFYVNGFCIYFYNRWVDLNLPRRHPARSPWIMGFYVGSNRLEMLCHKHHSNELDSAKIQYLYCNPIKN